MTAVEIEDARQALRLVGTDIDTVTRLADGRWLVATAGRHRVDVIDSLEYRAIARATATVLELARRIAGPRP